MKVSFTGFKRGIKDMHIAGQPDWLACLYVPTIRKYASQLKLNGRVSFSVKGPSSSSSFVLKWSVYSCWDFLVLACFSPHPPHHHRNFTDWLNCWVPPLPSHYCLDCCRGGNMSVHSIALLATTTWVYDRFHRNFRFIWPHSKRSANVQTFKGYKRYFFSDNRDKCLLYTRLWFTRSEVLFNGHKCSGMWTTLWALFLWQFTHS